MNLAIFTGRPAFPSPLYVGAPIVEAATRRRFNNYMAGVFERNYFTNNGPLVQELERKIAALHGVKYCAAVCNATIAQILLLKALDLKGEIILPSFTFIATAHACLWQNLTPVFCDISPTTLMIDPEKAEALITPRTSAILGVHLFGNVCDAPALAALAQKRHLKLLFDAGHAFACSLGDRSVGGFGNVEFLSFHATKIFGTFEGGATLTNDAELDARIKFLRNFGFKDYDDVEYMGLNGKMTEASAAMGLAALPEVSRRIERCQRTYGLFRERLNGLPGIRLHPVGEKGRGNFQYIVMQIDEKEFGVSRKVVYRVLWKENVMGRRYFYPGCHGMAFYRAAYPTPPGRLPVTDAVSERILCLPSNLKNPDRDVARIVGVLRAIHQNAKEVKQWAVQNP